MSTSGCKLGVTSSLTADDKVNLPSFTVIPAEFIGSPCGAMTSCIDSIPRSNLPDCVVYVVTSPSSCICVIFATP